MNTVKSLNSHKISLRSTGDIEKSTKLNQKEDSKFFQAEKEEQNELNSVFPDEIALHIMRKVKDFCTISSLSLTSKATYNILKSPEMSASLIIRQLKTGQLVICSLKIGVY